jgi:hypothetical protein
MAVILYICTVERYKNQIMKKVIKNTKKGILMVTMFATLLSFANEVSFFTIKNDAKGTTLTLESVKEGNLLSIKDDNGLILYKELIEKAGVYTKGFDLTSLPDGTYIFELDKDMEINTIPFTVKSSSVLFNKEQEKIIYKPYVKVINDMAYITKLALNKEPLKIKVYFNGSSGYELMLSEKIENTQNIKRAYKLTGLEKGNYKIVFDSEGREFTKLIN